MGGEHIHASTNVSTHTHTHTHFPPPSLPSFLPGLPSQQFPAATVSGEKEGLEVESHLRPVLCVEAGETETEIQGVGPRKWEQVVEVVGRGRC